MRHQAQYARGDDTVPYDRELIRSGGVSQPADRRRHATRRSTPRRAAPRGGGGRSFLRALRNLVLLALLLVVIGVALLGIRGAAFNSSVSTAGFPSTALVLPLNGSDRVNVLMVGYGGGDHAGAYLADSIQVLSIDPATDTTTTIPIPRDLWIEGISAFPQGGKVNEVFATGIGSETDPDLDAGAELMAATLSEVTGLEIEHWLSIDFEGFRDMVDAVGGVTVDNPRRFCWTTIPEFHQAGRWDMGCFEQGTLHLDGEEALEYSRARYTSVVEESTDFARSVRQARIMGALRAGVSDGGIGAIPAGLGLMDAMEGRMRTDLSAIDLGLLAGHLSSDRRIELSEDIVLMATTNTIGQYILIPIDWTGPGAYDGLRAYLRTALERPVSSAASDAP